MSTNKTTNLGLHSWVRSDAFRMDEFNDNFDKLDRVVGENKTAVATKAEQSVLTAEIAAREALARTVPRIAFGTYTGTGEPERFFKLDFTPKMLLIFGPHSMISNNTYCYGGMVLADDPTFIFASRTVMKIEEGGFRVYHTDNGGTTNLYNNVFRYFAIG